MVIAHHTQSDLIAQLVPFLAEPRPVIGLLRLKKEPTHEFLLLNRYRISLYGQAASYQHDRPLSFVPPYAVNGHEAYQLVLKPDDFHFFVKIQLHYKRSLRVRTQGDIEGIRILAADRVHIPGKVANRPFINDRLDMASQQLMLGELVFDHQDMFLRN